jgi:D-xylose 1-dehydrogenase (NADP+, D-xylono-1,5-lactone-forming)
MKPLRFGIISTARIATKAIMPAMQASRLCDIVAISSRDGDRAAAIAKDFGIARSYGSHQALLDDPNVDAVYIATPNDSHVELALRAAAAGKHVLCEKPIALNGAEAATLLEARDRYKVEITEALMVRYQPRWRAAREFVRQGRFGRVEVIHASFTVQIDDPEDIRLKPELGGGALYDVGVYPITAARFLFEAEPVRAQCRLVRSTTGVDRTILGSLEFPDERYLMFSASLGLSWAHWIRAIGTDGWCDMPISFVPQPGQATSLALHGRADIPDENVEILTYEPSNQYLHQVETFARVILEGQPQPWPIENAVAGMRVLDAIRASAENGGRLVDISSN